MSLHGMSDVIPGPECEAHPDEYDPLPPSEVWHDVETVDDHDGPAFERCTACGKSDRGLDPERCPAKELPSENEVRIEERASLADGRDRSLDEFGTVGARTDSMLGVPARGDD